MRPLLVKVSWQKGLDCQGLKGHKTGGTMHIVVNNQIGFTTAPHFSRSSPYPTDIALMVEAPIFHVNGDDPEAVVHAARVATEFRQKFKKDVVVDIICYRRFGHNEGDEPMFTNPLMYKKIKTQKTTLTLYTERLVRDGLIPEGEIEDMKASFQSLLNTEFEAGKDYKPNKADWLDGRWSKMNRHGEEYQRGATAMAEETFDEVAQTRSAACQRAFPIHKTVQRMLDAKSKALSSGEGIDWATGEALAFGSSCSQRATRCACLDKTARAAPLVTATPGWSIKIPKNAITRSTISVRDRASMR